MHDLAAEIRAMAAEMSFSGAVRVDIGSETVMADAFGSADRAHAIPNAIGTRFGIASGTKGFTALTVMALVEQGTLDLSTPARVLLGDHLPLISPDVTIEHLLAHRSGIGDYLDEEEIDDITEYVLAAPVHRLATTDGYLEVLDGIPTRFGPGERFSYCNSGYVVLALVAERAGGAPFHDLVRRYVCAPAGLRATEFLRSDELPGDAASGYLTRDGLRTNVLHLPVRGSGDGGIFTTVADMHTFWTSMFAGRIVDSGTVAEMVRPRSEVPSESSRYGLGFWLAASTESVMLVGGDAGVSFHSVHQPSRDLTHTVVSNTSDGAWPIARRLRDALATNALPDAVEG
jgi:CubicO group peptidase (beta-lactamase class C family)